METTVTLDDRLYPVTILQELEMFYVDLPAELVGKFNLPQSFAIQNLDGVLESEVTSYGIYGLSIFEQVSNFIRQEPDII